jgi:Protein of unknown function (DUF3616)
MLLELEVKCDDGELKLKTNGPNDRRYRKHLLDLQGCGLRDLCLETSGRPSLLLLAGPTMALDGAVRVHRWPLPDTAKADTITASERCPALMEIPHGQGKDRAEGIELIGERRQELLVMTARRRAVHPRTRPTSMPMCSHCQRDHPAASGGDGAKKQGGGTNARATLDAGSSDSIGRVALFGDGRCVLLSTENYRLISYIAMI